MLLLRKQKISIGEDVETLEPLCTLGGNVTLCIGYRKQCNSSSKIKIELTCDPGIPLPAINPKEFKAVTQNK